MTAKETIIEIIKDHVEAMNIAREKYDNEVMDRMRYKLNGMMICLKHFVPEDEFYNINYNKGYEFGYYKNFGDEHKWFHIAGLNIEI